MDVVVDIGEMPVQLTTTSQPLVDLLKRRYAGFVNSTAAPLFHFDISIVDPDERDLDRNLSVRASSGRWHLARGDFRAEWDAATGSGWIRQAVNPYAVDSVLRIVHTLLLATREGLLLHAASAVRDGRAYLFVGPSGAGKTTIARLAPPDASLLTDEISYVRRVGDRYLAFGTPFAGELGHSGRPIAAPLAAIYRLEQQSANSLRPLGAADTVRLLMRNALFFADDPSLSGALFDTACRMAEALPAYRFGFVPDGRAWDLVA
jgi:hypothetical protein